MQVLLDTHSLIWYLEGDHRLSARARGIIDNASLKIFASHINFYEMAIKMHIDKFPTRKTLSEFIQGTKECDIDILSISESHLVCYAQIPLIGDHRDPFDRLLMATALHENLDIITADAKFRRYEDLINIIW